MPRVATLLSALIVLVIPAHPLRAETATVAVAANFLAPLEELKTLFEAETGHEIVISSGSTGQLYAQVTNSAPFDVFLSADSEHATRLAAEGLGDEATQFTYAVGKLALWTHAPAKFEPIGLATLRRTDFRWLAIANPELAPYGLAAEQTLRYLGLWEPLQDRLVRGQSIAQTFAMAETGNAELAFVALSQAVSYQGIAGYFEVPSELYDPLRQDAILLRRGADNAAAQAFVEWLRGPRAAAVIAEFGYETGHATAH
jgi:molybdate transport system substrate-binding protein